MAAEGELSRGQCLCGKVSFVAIVTGEEMDACHCGMCRRWAGGPFMCVSVTGLAFNDPHAIGVYHSSEYAERIFCPSCGTSLAWRMLDGSFTTMSAFVFDEPLAQPLKTEIFVDEQPATYAFAGDTTKMTGAEVAAMFEGK